MQLKFGDWTIDDERRLLIRGGMPVHLEPKAFELLTVLLREHPKVISKQELIQRIWPDAAVTDASLTRLIKQLRAALGDDSAAPRYIRTVPRFGYAFDGAVSASGSRATAPCRLVTREGQVLLYHGHQVLGRATHDVRTLDDPSVSRRHAAVIVDEHQVWIEDLGSKNGTFVGSERIHGRRPLRDGDTVRLGLIALVFRRSSPSSVTRTAAHGEARPSSRRRS